MPLLAFMGLHVLKTLEYADIDRNSVLLICNTAVFLLCVVTVLQAGYRPTFYNIVSSMI
jgi:hypothetical protein